MTYMEATDYPFCSEPATPRVEPRREDHFIDTAQRWTLHVKLDIPSAIHKTTKLVSLQSQGIVTDWLGGDSWTEWSEPVGDTDEIACHIAFPAGNAHSARAAAYFILGYLGIPPTLFGTDAALSTAGDWAAQVGLEAGL
jgi:hypothetical protein